MTDTPGGPYDEDDHRHRALRRWLEPLTARWSDEPFDLLLIGAGDGGLLRTAAEWFPAARLVGLDVRRVAPAAAPDRITVLHGDPGNPATVAALLRDRRFRAVIDRGGGRPGDREIAFRTLFPALEPAGFFACLGGIAARPRALPGEPPPLPTHADPDPFLDLLLALARRVAAPLTSGSASVDVWSERVAPLVEAVLLGRDCSLVTRSEVGG